MGTGLQVYAKAKHSNAARPHSLSTHHSLPFPSLLCPAGITEYAVDFHQLEDTPAAQQYALTHTALPPPPSPQPPPPFTPGAIKLPMLNMVEEGEAIIMMDDPNDFKTTDNFPIWAFLAVGLVIQMEYFFGNLVMPAEDVGILFIMISKMRSGKAA